MTREQALPYVAYVVTDALGELPVAQMLTDPRLVRLVGWQCGSEPLFVAVQSYLPDTRIDADEATEIATDFLVERNWFDGEATQPDYVI